MESTAFFEKKISITPSDFNEVKSTQSVEVLLLRKAQQSVEGKCSEQGYVLPGSIKLISRSMGYFESARFTGDAIYYVKLEARIIYPVDGIKITGEVTRKNKMGLYVNYNDAIHIQVPRDLHLGSQEYDQVEVGDHILVELKRSKFAINDPYILASGLYVETTQSNRPVEDDFKEEEVPMEALEPNAVTLPKAAPIAAPVAAPQEISDEELFGNLE
jgi:DNA-directed RNA polymerase subunit E'/Rpb7